MTERRIAIVTGGNRGLGLETARQLAMRGYAVVLTSRNKNAGEAAADALRRVGGDVYAFPLDVQDVAGVRRLRDFVEQSVGAAHVLINNAGVFLDEHDSSLSVEPDILKATLDTNLVGPWLLCQAFVPNMMAQTLAASSTSRPAWGR